MANSGEVEHFGLNMTANVYLASQGFKVRLQELKSVTAVINPGRAR